jgi:pilus assembly protein CpaE
MSIIDQLRGQFAFTVLDCEHHMSGRTLAALDAADRIVLVTQLNVPALRSTQRTLTLCRRLGYPGEKIHVLVNRYQSSDVVSIADATQVLGQEIFFKLPNDYKTSAAALTKGITVAEQDGSSQLASGYSHLAARLNGRSASKGHDVNGASASRLGRLFHLRKKS